MKAYGKNAQKRMIRQQVVEEASAFVEHCDLIYLMLLHDLDGFGAKRLRVHFREFVKKYDEYKRRYCCDDDDRTFGGRNDTYVLKQHLKELGFDYDAEYESAIKEIDAEREQA